jgi:hypothetical protein
MWTLSGFSDAISPDFDAQCALVAKLGLQYLEFRSAWDTNILDLETDQLNEAGRILAAYGLKVSSVGSPIGKIIIDEDLEPHLVRMQHAADVPVSLKPSSSGSSPSCATDLIRTTTATDVLRRMRAAGIGGRRGQSRAVAREREGDLRRRLLLARNAPRTGSRPRRVLRT